MAAEEKKNRYFPKVFIQDGPPSLRDVLSVLFRQKNKIIFFFVSVVAAVTIVTMLSPDLFEAETKLLIRVGRENMAVDPSIVGPTMSVYQSREDEVNSELSILKSRFVIEKVVDTIGPEPFLEGEKQGREKSGLQNLGDGLTSVLRPFRNMPDKTSLLREKAITTVMDNLNVEIQKKSNIIRLSFLARSPQMAERVLDTLIEFYLEHHIKVHASQTSSGFFMEESENLRRLLSEKEEKLKAFYIKNGIVSIDKQKEIVLDQISRLQNEVDMTATQISASRAKINALENDLKGRPETVVINRVSGKENPAASAIKERLIDLRLKEVDLSARYPDDYRLLIDVRTQIKLAEQALAKEDTDNTEITTGIDAGYQEIKMALTMENTILQEQIARKKSLTNELDARKRKLSELADQEVTTKNLQRDIDIIQNKYLKYSDNLQRAQISEAMDINKVSNVSIVQPATAFSEPVRPRRRLNLLLGIFLGLFGGVGLAFLWDYFDDSIKTRDDIEKRLGLPVLATVSHEEFESCI